MLVCILPITIVRFSTIPVIFGTPGSVSVCTLCECEMQSNYTTTFLLEKMFTCLKYLHYYAFITNFSAFIFLKLSFNSFQLLCYIFNYLFQKTLPLRVYAQARIQDFFEVRHILLISSNCPAWRFFRYTLRGVSRLAKTALPNIFGWNITILIFTIF